MCIPEPWEQHDRYSNEQERKLEQMPICEYCGFHIQDDYLWDIDGTLCHEKCAEELFRKDAENYE